MERIEQEVIIKSGQGLHARPAAVFVQIASKFDSSVEVSKDDDVVDGKSIIALLSLGATQGSSIKLIVEGEDSQDAFLELKTFLESQEEL